MYKQRLFAEVSRLNNKYKIRLNRAANSSISYYWTYENNKETDKKFFLTTSKELEMEFTIKHEKNSRIYFVLIEGTNKYIFGERTLDIPGMNNFRDLGGYITGDDHRVKWGILYRSDHIYNASNIGIERLKKLDIKTIIDYRSEDEIAKYPNKTISQNIKTYVFDPSAHTAELSAQFSASKEDEDKELIKKIKAQIDNGTLKEQYDIVTEQYNNFVKNEDSKLAFGNMLKLLTKKDTTPLIQHCRGGKDRTGYGSLLVLGVLGVSKDQIIQDYMLTGKNRIERNNYKMESYRKHTNDPNVLEYLYSLIDTRQDFIETSYNKIIGKYSSIENYAVKELGLKEKDIFILKETYLEK